MPSSSFASSLIRSWESFNISKITLAPKDVILKVGEVIEFCDPRIQSIKQTIEEVFDIEIQNHSLYFYGTKKAPK